MLLALLSSALLAACSQTIGVPPPSIGSAQDYSWSPSELSAGINYYVLRNGVGTYHRLTSPDGTHVLDGALGNQVTMVMHVTQDSVVIDSIGSNFIFTLPSGYTFARIVPPDTTSTTVTLYDTTKIITQIIDTAHGDTVKIDTVTRITPRDTTIREIVPGDTVPGSLLALNGLDLDSGASWQAGTLSGPGLGNGIPVIATVLDHVDALLLPGVDSTADSSFGESFQIRYAPQVSADSLAASPVYWIVYFSRQIGPVLVEQHTLGYGGTSAVTQRAQIVRVGP